jgi:hypothetical protein
VDSPGSWLAYLLGGLATALVLSLSDLGTALFALANEAALAAEVAQFTRLLHFLGEATQQSIEALIIAHIDSHVPAHPLSLLAIPAPICLAKLLDNRFADNHDNSGRNAE